MRFAYPPYPLHVLVVFESFLRRFLSTNRPPGLSSRPPPLSRQCVHRATMRALPLREGDRQSCAMRSVCFRQSPKALTLWRWGISYPTATAPIVLTSGANTALTHGAPGFSKLRMCCLGRVSAVRSYLSPTASISRTACASVVGSDSQVRNWPPREPGRSPTTGDRGRPWPRWRADGGAQRRHRRAGCTRPSRSVSSHQRRWARTSRRHPRGTAR